MRAFFIRFCCLLVLPALSGLAMSAETAGETAKGSEYTGVSGGTLFQTFFALFLVVVLIFIIARIIKRLNPRFRNTQANTKVLASYALGNRERLVLIEVYGQRLLLGVAPGNVRLIKDMTGIPDPEPPPEQSEPGRFSLSGRSRLFERLLKR